MSAAHKARAVRLLAEADQLVENSTVHTHPEAMRMAELRTAQALVHATLATSP